jgi:segregation and condensation protein B
MSVENEHPNGVDGDSEGAPSTDPAVQQAENESLDPAGASGDDVALGVERVGELHHDRGALPGEQGDLARVTMPAGDIGRAHLKGLIEALVFVSDRPVSLSDIAKSAAKADRKLVRSLVDELRQDYRSRGIHLEEVAGGLIFRTNPEYGPFIRDAAAKKPVKMSRAQLEALAIIAYRQPLTRPEVDEIRGVDSGPVMKMLLDRDDGHVPRVLRSQVAQGSSFAARVHRAVGRLAQGVRSRDDRRAGGRQRGDAGGSGVGRGRRRAGPAARGLRGSTHQPAPRRH